MNNLYLVTLNSNKHILIVASDKGLVSDYCLPIMRFGEWIEDIEFIVVVGDDYHEDGEIIKKF